MRERYGVFEARHLSPSGRSFHPGWLSPFYPNENTMTTTAAAQQQPALGDFKLAGCSPVPPLDHGTLRLVEDAGRNLWGDGWTANIKPLEKGDTDATD